MLKKEETLMRTIRSNDEWLAFLSECLGKIQLNSEYWNELPKEEWTFGNLSTLAKKVLEKEQNIRVILDDELFSDLDSKIHRSTVVFITAPKEVIMTAIRQREEEYAKYSTILLSMFGMAVGYQEYEEALQLLADFLELKISDWDILEFIQAKEQMEISKKKMILDLQNDLVEIKGCKEYNLPKEGEAVRFFEDLQTFYPTTIQLLNKMSLLNDALEAYVEANLVSMLDMFS